MKFSHAYVWLCASHQVLGEVIDELSVVQALVIVEVVLKHGCDLLWSHHRSTHSHCILTRLHTFKNKIQICRKQCSSLPCNIICVYVCVCVCTVPTVPWPPVGLGQPGVTAGWPGHCGSDLWTLALLSQTWTGSPLDRWKHSGSHHSPGWAEPE